MKAGRVISLRVNPKDCMSCLDVLEAAGVLDKRMSFSQAVSLALSSAMETFRTQGIIPNRDGFEYAEMMEPFGGTWSGRHKQKLEVQKIVEKVGSELHIRPPIEEEPAAVPMSTKQMHSKKAARVPDLPEIDPIEFKELTQEFNDLNTKRDNKHVDGIVWTTAEEQRWKELYEIIFGF